MIILSLHGRKIELPAFICILNGKTAKISKSIKMDLLKLWKNTPYNDETTYFQTIFFFWDHVKTQNFSFEV